MSNPQNNKTMKNLKNINPARIKQIMLTMDKENYIIYGKKIKQLSKSSNLNNNQKYAYKRLLKWAYQTFFLKFKR